MFESIARVVVRFRWLVVALWIAGVAAGIVFLPSLSSVTSSANAGFLSADVPSRQAAELAAPLQGNDPAATATMVVSRSDGPLTAADDAAIGAVKQHTATVPGVVAVRDQGVSADGRARTVLVVTAAQGSGSAVNANVVDDLRAGFATVHHPGLVVHLTGPLAQAAVAKAATARTGSNIQRFTVIFVIVLLFVVYRSLLAPLVTLVPAVAALLLAGPLIGQASTAGLPVSPVVQLLLLGAGTDYALFLVFRVREEIRRDRDPRAALIAAMARVGESIAFSAATVIAALSCLALASFGLYRGLGPALAIGVAVMLAAALTLLPALLAILGRAVFWPAHPAPGQQTTGLWGRVAERAVRRPVPVLLAGVIMFGALAAGLTGFATAGFTSAAPTSGTDSADGNAVLAAHFPAATASPESLVLRFDSPLWSHLASLTQADQQLATIAELRAVSGPLDPNGTSLTVAELADLHARLGPAQNLPATSPAGEPVSAQRYQAYRASAQFISADGRTVRFSALAAAGPTGSRAAIDAVPALRATLGTVAGKVGASGYGIAGPDATAYDIYAASTDDHQIDDARACGHDCLPCVHCPERTSCARTTHDRRCRWRVLPGEHERPCPGWNYMGVIGGAGCVWLGCGAGFPRVRRPRPATAWTGPR